MYPLPYSLKFRLMPGIYPFQDNPSYTEDRCHAFQCDVTVDDLEINVPSNSVDIVTLIFVLSAILPSKMPIALQNLLKVVLS